MAKELGIKDDHIFFTNGIYKWRKIKDLGIEKHYEDKESEKILIEDNTNCKVIKV